MRRKLSNQANGLTPENEVPGAPYIAQSSGNYSAGNDGAGPTYGPANTPSWANEDPATPQPSVPAPSPNGNMRTGVTKDMEQLSLEDKPNTAPEAPPLVTQPSAATLAYAATVPDPAATSAPAPPTATAASAPPPQQPEPVLPAEPTKENNKMTKAAEPATPAPTTPVLDDDTLGDSVSQVEAPQQAAPANPYWKLLACIVQNSQMSLDKFQEFSHSFRIFPALRLRRYFTPKADGTLKCSAQAMEMWKNPAQRPLDYF